MSELKPGNKGLVGQADETQKGLERFSQAVGKTLDDIQRPTYFHANTVNSDYLTTTDPTFHYLSPVAAGGTATWSATVTPMLEVNVPPSTELQIELNGMWAMARASLTPYTSVDYLQMELVNVTSASSVEVLRRMRFNVLHDLSPRSDYGSFYISKRVTPPAGKVYRVGLRAWKTDVSFTAFLIESYELSITPRVVRAGTDNRQ